MVWNPCIASLNRRAGRSHVANEMFSHLMPVTFAYSTKAKQYSSTYNFIDVI